jgi:hypothetical protein
MRLRHLLPLLLALPCPAVAASMSEAFEQGATLGRTGNAAARGQISSGAAQTTVPHFNSTPPEASYFGGAGLGTPAASRLGACVGAVGGGTSSGDQACTAVDFTQTNPARRPSFTLAPTDPLLTRARTITADPHAIAGNLAGTYSACTVQTLSRPDVFETQICHQFRPAEPVTCQKLRTVQVSWADSCPVGTWFASTWVNTWGNGEAGARYAGIAIQAYCRAGATVRMALQAICTETPCAGAADIEVDAETGSASPQIFTNFIGRSWFTTDLFNRVDYQGGGCTDTQCGFNFCTRYEESTTNCDETTGTCTTETQNEPRACGTFTFDRPRSIAAVTDAWDNQCAPFEARLR